MFNLLCEGVELEVEDGAARPQVNELRREILYVIKGFGVHGDFVDLCVHDPEIRRLFNFDVEDFR